MTVQSATVEASEARPGRHAWFVLALLTVANFFNALDRYSLALVLEPIKREFGASDTMMSLLGGFAYASAYGLAAIPLAALADRGASRKVLGFCLLFWSAATMACGFVQRFGQLLIMRAGVGLGEAGGIPASLALISGYFSQKQRPFAMGVFYSANGLSLCLGVPIISLVIAEWGWRAGFYVFGALGVVFAPFVFLFVREPRAAAAPAQREKSLPALAAMFRVRPFVLILLSHFLVFTGVGANTTFTVAFFMRFYGFSYPQVAALNGVPMGVAGVLGGLAGGALVGRIVRRTGNLDWMNRVSAAAALAAAISLAFAFAGISVWISAAACIAGYFFIMARYATSYAATLEYAPAGAKGAVAAVLLILQSVLAGTLGPLLIGLVSDHLAPTHGDKVGLQLALLIVCPVTMIVGGLVGYQPLRDHLPEARAALKRA
jgi:predicted MFS family arabinose efflux permease